MVKRAFDILISLFVLAITAPLMVFAALGIRVASPGPVFYHATRGGLHGVPFRMLKLRTMHVGADREGSITSPNDQRVFVFGSLLRALKIDELPQFINILRGDMSVVGPRPEDKRIIDTYYCSWMRKTLEVLPGVTSPGAIFGYAFGDRILDEADPEGSYVSRMLAPKLALELAYIERANFWSDLDCIYLTVKAVIWNALGRQVEPRRRDMQNAYNWVPPDSFSIFK